MLLRGYMYFTPENYVLYCNCRLIKASSLRFCCSGTFFPIALLIFPPFSVEKKKYIRVYLAFIFDDFQMFFFSILGSAKKLFIL